MQLSSAMQRTIVCLLALVPTVVSSPSPYVMTWSDKSYGPDGPWNAISVGMGTAAQKIALYPGATWETRLFTKSFCANTSLSSFCYADSAGLFDPDTSDNWDNKSILFAPNGDEWSELKMGSADAVPVNALAERAMDTIDLGGTRIHHLDLIAISQAYQTYPGGQRYPLEVGALSLGCPDINQYFTLDNGTRINASFVNSALYVAGTIPSYSFGMHIGSASIGIPGSLMLGGYDSNRIIGSTSAQSYSGGKFPIRLLDIGIGVAAGGSPWNYSNKSGLLGKGNSSLHSLDVYASPPDPYIYLPKSSCDAIASELPITHDSNLGLYIWNTSDPLYSQIVSSPCYLSFDFSKDVKNTANITIKVPFTLLNLTLEPPLVETPKSYFPCMGTDGTPTLGRAFLQAAFLGANWGPHTGNWFLAQAPGPGFFSTPKIVNIEDKDSEISGTTNNWDGTWSSYWTPLPASSSSATPISTSSGDSEGSDDNGLSTGAKAGIAIGCVVVGMLLITLVAIYFRSRRRRNTAEKETHSHVFHALPGIPVKQFEGAQELSARQEQQEPYELGTGSDR